MRNKLLALLLILGTSVGMLSAAGKPVARVKMCRGSAEVRSGLRQTRPVAIDTRLTDGVSLNLPDADQVTLVFYQDGHSEELKGPCLVRIGMAGCQVVHGGSGCLTKIVAKQRQLVLPQSGNLQSVGGSIAGISDPATAKIRLRSVPPQGDARPAAPAAKVENQSTSKGALKLPEPSGGAPPAEEILLSFSQAGGKGRFKHEGGSASQLTLLLKGSGPDQPLRLRAGEIGLPHLPAGKPYQLMVYSGRDLQQTLPFQILPPAQQQELAELLANGDLSQEVLVIDRLEQLGLPFMAAQRAEQLLKQLEDKDIGLLSYLYQLYRGDLHDAGRAADIRNRAKAQGCQLP